MQENNVKPMVEKGGIVINEGAIPEALGPDNQFRSPSQVPVIEEPPKKKKGPLGKILLLILLVLLGYLIYDRFFNEKVIEENNDTNETNKTVIKIEKKTKDKFTIEATKNDKDCYVFKVNGHQYKESCTLELKDIEIKETIDNYAIIHYVDGNETYELIDMEGNQTIDAGEYNISHLEYNEGKIKYTIQYIPLNLKNYDDIAGCNETTAGNYNLDDIIQKVYEASIIDGKLQEPVEVTSQTVGNLRENYECPNKQ